MPELFYMKLIEIQPSQLFLNQEKITKLMKQLNFQNLAAMEPIPIKKLNREIIYVDGHTRAFLFWKKGFNKIKVCWEDEDLDWELYKICVNWCKEAGIKTISDLKDRIIDNTSYQEKWIKRCHDMHVKIEEKRKNLKK